MYHLLLKEALFSHAPQVLLFCSRGPAAILSDSEHCGPDRKQNLYLSDCIMSLHRPQLDVSVLPLRDEHRLRYFWVSLVFLQNRL